ncbi:acyl-CoA dehydrogenase [Stutzerimonas chloritidismutans]
MEWLRLVGPLEHLPMPPSLALWFDEVQRQCAGCGTLESALLGGRLAATPGLAFLAGYQAALRGLWASAPAGIGAFCATEQRSLRPAEMRTRLVGGRLNGTKDYVTAGPAARWLLVAARDEGEREAPRLRLCLVDSLATGVTIEPGPPLPLIPDIPHGRLRLVDVQAEPLAGDGWDGYVKLFRTLEDLHVLAALVSWLQGIGLTCQWPQSLLLRLLGLMPAAAEVARLAPAAPATHLLLAGLLAQFETLQPEVDAAFAGGPSHWANLWQRDRRVLDLARSAQARRQARASEAVGWPATAPLV